MKRRAWTSKSTGKLFYEIGECPNMFGFVWFIGGMLKDRPFRVNTHLILEQYELYRDAVHPDFKEPEAPRVGEVNVVNAPDGDGYVGSMVISGLAWQQGPDGTWYACLNGCSAPFDEEYSCTECGRVVMHASHGPSGVSG